ncbi:DUF885 domain-containing protein [Permianibacter aggregans]|uniref:Uncharacterized protein (DUF885 family) n=1 Tax=Permianibacter aggregans TaxID=1510150 RepID=A0A4R6UHI6_9GAMM|nr:DUF885 domain-containing protein [Permianibacter aggregans]QGX41226.1 DUF885 domain-containing protein [Permianibacter aggregans]TDQ45832.1 uncharacterized protein (DUF885 family) [Permianibacter aggregans]
MQTQKPKPTTTILTLDAAINNWWQDEMRFAPLYASYCGVRQYDDQLPDSSEQAIKKQTLSRREHLRNIESAIKLENGLDELSRQVALYQLQTTLRLAETPDHLAPLGSSHGLHVQLTRLLHLADLSTAEGRENYLSRLRGLPVWLAQQQQLLHKALERQQYPYAEALRAVPIAIRFMASEQGLAQTFEPTSDQAVNDTAFQQRLQNVLQMLVAPALQTFAEFIETVYLKHSRPLPGLCAIPDGEAWYQALIRQHTSLSLTAAEIHQIGLEEVAATREKAEAILKELGLPTPFDKGIDALRNDPRQYAQTPEQLLQYATQLCETINAALPRLFSRLPHLPFHVKATPAQLAPAYPSGFYLEPPADGSRPGEYWVNTHELNSRPLYVLPALTLHEAMPGHHLQIALTQERENLPAFRRCLLNTAYEEGWALYAESLGNEIGLYDDPHAKLGWLSYRLWRAARLVIDTGLHAKGWTREQAVQYLYQHSSLSKHESETEVDRYITWPGQALGYLLGEREMHALRRECSQQLGFDLQRFHEQLLCEGELPLPLLRRNSTDRSTISA